MDYCWYISLKITPTNQEFVADETDEIITRGLRFTSDNFRFRVVEGLGGIRYYDCVAEISNNAFALFPDCRYYRWRVENEIISQCRFPALIRANKINVAQFVKRVASYGAGAPAPDAEI